MMDTVDTFERLDETAQDDTTASCGGCCCSENARFSSAQADLRHWGRSCRFTIGHSIRVWDIYAVMANQSPSRHHKSLKVGSVVCTADKFFL